MESKDHNQAKGMVTFFVVHPPPTLFFFFSTAILGLFLVVKVNYKLEISWVEEALQWHVDCGIGFALVAVFHLIPPGLHPAYSCSLSTFSFNPTQLEAGCANGPCGGNLKSQISNLKFLSD